MTTSQTHFMELYRVTNCTSSEWHFSCQISSSPLVGAEISLLRKMFLYCSYWQSQAFLMAIKDMAITGFYSPLFFIFLFFFHKINLLCILFILRRSIPWAETQWFQTFSAFLKHSLQNRQIIELPCSSSSSISSHSSSFSLSLSIN